jgi:origin recognition complex subunit 3
MRHNASLDSILTILQVGRQFSADRTGVLTISAQIAHMKHFSVEPLSLFAQTNPPVNTLSQPSSFPFLDALLMRLNTPSNPSEAEVTDWSQQTLPQILAAVDKARTEFYRRARRLRIGFGLIKLAQEFMMQQGYKGLNWNQHPEGTPVLDVMIDVMRGKVGSDVKFLGSMVRYLPFPQLT